MVHSGNVFLLQHMTESVISHITVIASNQISPIQSLNHAYKKPITKKMLIECYMMRSGHIYWKIRFCYGIGEKSLLFDPTLILLINLAHHRINFIFRHVDGAYKNLLPRQDNCVGYIDLSFII